MTNVYCEVCRFIIYAGERRYSNDEHSVICAACKVKFQGGTTCAYCEKTVDVSDTHDDCDKAMIIVRIPGAAAGALATDEAQKWPGLECIRQQRIGATGIVEVLKMPRKTAEQMLDEALDRGSNSSSGEGYDQDASGKYGCRVAARRLAKALGKPEPKFWRS